MINKDILKQRIAHQNKIRELSNSNKMPSTGQMAKNLGQSIVRNVQSVAAGNKLTVSDDEKQKRLNVCRGCEYFNSASERCSKCGCWLATKTYLKAEKCPLGRW